MLTVKSADRKGMLLIDTIPTPNDDFFGSVTYVLDTDKPWLCDFGNGYYVEVIPWNHSGDYWEPMNEYRLFHKIEEDRHVGTRMIKSQNPLSSLRVYSSRDFVRLTVDNGIDIFEKEGRMLSLQSSSQIALSAHRGAKIIKKDVRFDTIGRPDRHDVKTDMDISGQDMTANNFIGKWKYLDRVTPEDSHVLTGGQYTLALVEDDNDPENFLIIYLDGDTSGRSMWSPGDVKGKLRRTPFAGNYDLDWYDSEGRLLDVTDSYAVFEGTNLVTFYFPLLGSQLRFYRVAEE